MPRKESKIVISGDTLFVELTRGGWAEVDTDSMEVVHGFAWRLHSNGYAVRNRLPHTDGPGPQTILMHRVIFEYHADRTIDPDLTVDHKDRNKLNNCIDNLREANRHEQGFNRDLHSNNTSGYRGVTWNKQRGKWHARYKLDGKMNHLGSFEHLEDAIRARQEFDRSNHRQIQPEEIPG